MHRSITSSPPLSPQSPYGTTAGSSTPSASGPAPQVESPPLQGRSSLDSKSPPRNANLPRSAANRSPGDSAVIDIPASPTPSQLPPAGHSASEARKEVGSASTFSGQVEIKDGRLTSSEPLIADLLAYAGIDPAHVHLGGPASLTMTLDPGARQMHEALEARCAVEEVDVRPQVDAPLEKKSVSGNVQIALLQEIIQNGRAALGDKTDIEINGRVLPLYDHLATLQPSITSDHEALAQPIREKLAGDSDLRAKLAAASLLQIATQKQMAPVGLAGSLLVSSGLGTLWELKADPKLKEAAVHMLKNSGIGSPTKAVLSAVLGPMIDSVPPVFIETLDTLCVLYIIETMKGNKDISLKALLPKAMAAGAISSVLSFPNNMAEFNSIGTSVGAKIADIALGAITTEVAIAGAASGVPLEIKDNTDAMKAALVQQIRDGLLALPPPGKEPSEHVGELAHRALDADPGTSIAQKSLAVAATVGLVPLAIGKKALHMLPDRGERILRSIVFNPIEAIAMHLLVLGSKVAVPKLGITSDHGKHTDLHRLILQKAAAGPGGGEAPILPTEIDGIFRPEGDLLRRAGKGISNGINAGLDGARSAASFATRGLVKRSKHVDEQLPFESIRTEGPLLTRN